MHAKGMGKKSENRIGASTWIRNFMSVTQLCNIASVFGIFLWHSALVVIYHSRLC